MNKTAKESGLEACEATVQSCRGGLRPQLALRGGRPQHSSHVLSLARGNPWQVWPWHKHGDIFRVAAGALGQRYSL